MFAFVLSPVTVIVSKPPPDVNWQIGHFPPFVEAAQLALKTKASDVPLCGRFSKHETFAKLKPSDDAN